MGSCLAVRHVLPRVLQPLGVARARLDPTASHAPLLCLVAVAARVSITATERITVPRLVHVLDGLVASCRHLWGRAVERAQAAQAHTHATRQSLGGSGSGSGSGGGSGSGSGGGSGSGSGSGSGGGSGSGSGGGSTAGSSGATGEGEGGGGVTTPPGARGSGAPLSTPASPSGAAAADPSAAAGAAAAAASTSSPSSASRPVDARQWLGEESNAALLAALAQLRDACQALWTVCPQLSSSCVRHRVLCPSQQRRARRRTSHCALTAAFEDSVAIVSRCVREMCECESARVCEGVCMPSCIIGVDVRTLVGLASALLSTTRCIQCARHRRPQTYPNGRV
jgi:hypothetical protein